MSPSHDTKPVSEKRRLREVLQYVAAYRDLLTIEGLDSSPGTSTLPASYRPRASVDSTLTALAQLATLRLGTQRAQVSLIDEHRQYVLAEATPTLSLRAGPSGSGFNSLWLGAASVPRAWGMCEQILHIHPAAGTGITVIVNDIAQNKHFADRTYVQQGPRMRFYAAAALVSQHGAVVGTVSVFDDKPRSEGLAEGAVEYLQEIAATISTHLDTYTVQDQYRRGEKLTRGLMSFAQGASGLLPIEGSGRLDSTPSTPSKAVAMSDSQDTISAAAASEGPRAFLQPSRQPSPQPSEQSTSQTITQLTPNPLADAASSVGSNTIRAPGSAKHTSIKTLQDSILPMNSRSMFARAANVMMASSDLDGVVILDASVAATGHRQHPAAPDHDHERVSDGTDTAQSKSSSSEDPSGDSSSYSGPNRSSKSSSRRLSQVLGSAARIQQEIGPLAETNLARLLREFPHGKIFTFNSQGVSMSSTDDSASSGVGVDDDKDEAEEPHSTPPKRRAGQNRLHRAHRSWKAIQEMLPGARSVAFVPFWDYERSRWFAGCLCWNNSPDRLLSANVDLAYFNIFSHSIMRELSRLDALALNQLIVVPYRQKTTFVASISHELRSPLHGILGTLEFIKDTQLDTFQISMLNSLNACGQTLLDTLNHVMDYSKISETKRNVSTRKLKSTNTVRLSSKPLKTRRPKDPPFDLCIATEEVVEAVFSGASFVPLSDSSSKPTNVSPTDTFSESGRILFSDEPGPKRKTFYVVLDISPEDNWIYSFPIGSWKRTVMNIFGNALKHTAQGYISVSLRASEMPKYTGSTDTVTLTVTDTGTGMSSAFLANKAFQAFSQEDPHSTGVGLGLSIVRQIIETNGGKIEVSSDQSSGTKMTIKLALTRPENVKVSLPQQTQYLSWVSQLKGKRVCILNRTTESLSDVTEDTQDKEGLARFVNALAATLTNHLGMEVVQTSKWQGNDTDIVICPEPSFDYLASLRHHRASSGEKRAATTIFIAMDSLEAATLRSDVRVQNKESVVEIMTQPCGPYKLAYVLNQCLNRFDSPDENVPAVQSFSGTSQPDPSQEKTRLSSTPQRPASGSGADRLGALSHADFTPPPISPNALAVVRSGYMDPASPASPKQSKPLVSLSIRETATESKILITDDNAINRRLLVAFMKKYNLQYSEAENGLEALRIYQEGIVRFDIILMDMSMPVMDGMSATRAIRQYEQAYNIPRCCIIALTGLASASARLEAWNSGIDYFMTKPINFKELDSVLKKRPNRRMDRKKSNAEQVFNEQQEVAKEIQALEEEVAKTEPAVTDKTPTEEYKSPTEEHQPQGGHQGTLDDIQRQYEG